MAARPPLWPRLLAYGYGCVAVTVAAYFLYDIPVQVTDSYTNLREMVGESLWRTVSAEFGTGASYLRPLLWGHLHVLFTAAAAGGRYHEWFRGWHVVQIALLVWMFVRLLRPATIGDAALIPLGLAVLFGVHTFAGTVHEAFPVNTFMTVLLCCLATANLALADKPTWAGDATAVALFVFAALTVESGLLVWVVAVAAYLGGGRGLSARGVGGLTALLGGYFVLRFVVLHAGGPGLMERSSGFGFSVLDPPELIARFGDNPLPFYLYNIVTSAASVLFSEPRAGVFGVTRAMLDGSWRPYQLVNLVASAAAVALLVAVVWQRRREWLAWRLDRDDRIVLVFVAVLAANATISYPYTKDVIMSPAGMFLAAAVTVAARAQLAAASSGGALRVAAIAALLCVLSASWGMRMMAVHAKMRASAVAVRNEWAYVDQWLRNYSEPPTEPAVLALQHRLQRDAILAHPQPPALTARWINRWLDPH